MKRKSKTSRADGLGHWPRGKRRNIDAGQWSRIRIELSTLINEHYAHGVCSARACAAALGVSDRTIRRWLDGTDRPSPADQERCQRWSAEQRARVKAESAKPA